MTRGNQRELARAKNQKKQQAAGKAKGKEGDSITVRKERDADRMREKQKAAADKKAADGK